MDTLPQPLKAEYACAFSPDGQIDRRRGRRQQHPRLAVRLARQAGNQPDGDRPVRPRRADRPPGVHARWLEAGLAGRGPHGQGLANQRLQRAAGSGRTSPTCRRRWRSPATSSFLVGRLDGSLSSLRDPGGDARSGCGRPRPSRDRLGATNRASSARLPSTNRTTPPRRPTRLPSFRLRSPERSRAAPPARRMPTSTASPPRPASSG